MTTTQKPEEPTLFTPMVNNSVPPFVSVLMPVRNEEKHISACLDSIIANDYPAESYEILILDGMSSDATAEIVHEYARRYSNIHILKNAKVIQASAMNLGLREAKGQIIIRMDAHTIYNTDYIRQSVEILEETEAGNVGGVQRSIGEGYVANTIAIATTTPFGAGDAKFRYSDEEAWVNTVYLGAWHKETLESVGGFNEELVANEDYELNYRLRKSGKKILLSPKIRCQYYVSDSLLTLLCKYFRYGMWKVRMLAMHRESLRWRQVVPSSFVLAIFLSLILIPYSSLPIKGILGIYLLANLSSSTWVALQRGIRFLPLLPFVFAIMHVSWGVGFWAGMIRFWRRSLRIESLPAESNKR